MNIVDIIWNKNTGRGLQHDVSDYSEIKIVNRITLILFIFLSTIFFALVTGSVFFDTHEMSINDVRIVFAALSCFVVLLFMRMKKVFLAKIILSFLPVLFLIAYPVILSTVTSHMFFITSLIIVAYSTLPHFIFDYKRERTSYFLVVFFMFIVLIFSEYILLLINPSSIGWIYKKQWFFYIKLSEVLTFIYLNGILFSINKQNSQFRFDFFIKLNELYKINTTIKDQNLEIQNRNNKLVDYQLDLQSHNQMLINRANELNEQKQAINLLYEQIQTTYDQLIKAEKMATLGQLTTGIVQVIGTPIKSSQIYLKNLQHDLSRILEVLNYYSEINHENYQEIKKKIAQRKQEINFQQLLDNLYKLPKSMAGNINEAIELIRELKVFSSLNQAEMVPYDLVSGLNASLNLIVRQHHEIITVKKELGRISHVKCYPGRINQVFLNLLSFSANQLRQLGKEGQLFVSARMIKERNDQFVEINIAIEVEQKNCKMIQDNMHEFFNDPLQDVEQIGISIASNIVNEHHGQLELNWVDGKCTFSILLPVKPEPID